MKNKKSAFFIALGILVGPLLIYVILRVLTTQEYETLPVYQPEGIAEGETYTIPEFRFVSHTGDTITRDSLMGHIVVANIFFTSCKGVCPKLTNAMADVQEYFKGDEDVRFFSITSDPEYDSVAVLRQYADQYGAIDHQWYFVTGGKQEIYNLANKGFLFRVDMTAGPFTHDETFRIIDKEGHIRMRLKERRGNPDGDLFYNGGHPAAAGSIIDDVKLLRVEYDKRKRKG